MKGLILFVVMITLAAATVAFGDAAATTPAATTTVVSWFSENGTMVLLALLAISEVLALIPGLQGNGILDAIIKLLKSMVKK